MITKVRLLPLTALCAVAACGGSTETGPIFGTDVNLPAPGGVGSGYIDESTVDTLSVSYEALRTAIFDDNRFETTNGSGVVDMTGFIGMGEVDNEDQSIIGNLSMTVDFDMADVTGTVGDIAVYDTTGDSPVRAVDFTGTLDILGGANGSGFAADLTGTISADGDDYTLDVDLGGDLYDVDGTNTYVGSGTGSYVSNGNTVDLNADFVAQ